MRPLESILAAHPEFRTARFIKIDTDGFDIPILLANTALLTPVRPVLFFEYDPYFVPMPEDEVFSIFDKLRIAGYATALFYENLGDFVTSVTLDDKERLLDLHTFMTGREGKRYWDIATFSSEDADLADAVRRTELLFARRSRGPKSAPAETFQ